MNINKQETLEETSKKLILDEWLGDDKTPNLVKWGVEIGFEKGVKWNEEQNKNRYSEEEVCELIQFLSMNEEFNGYSSVSKETANYFLQQFKKK